MPLYNSNTAANGMIASIGPGDIANLWSAEQPTPGTSAATGSASVQVAPLPAPSGSNFSISFDIQFSGNPGTFEIDVQAATVDADANYALVATAGKLTGLSSGNNVHFDYVGPVVKFIRLLMVSRLNAVNVTATASR